MFVSRSSRIGETENALRHALDRGDAGAALGAARQLSKWQGRDELALGTALRLAALLARDGHPLAERARERWVERAQVEVGDWQLVVIAEAALDGLRVAAIEGACARVLAAVARDYEWTPVPAS